jgi:hypothetical protein
MFRFSPGNHPGLASPTGEEPPPRSLGPKAETHTLISQYSIVGSSNNEILANAIGDVKENNLIGAFQVGGHGLFVEGEGGKCISPFSLDTSHFPYANGRWWTTMQGLDSGHP